MNTLSRSLTSPTLLTMYRNSSSVTSGAILPMRTVLAVCQGLSKTAGCEPADCEPAACKPAACEPAGCEPAASPGAARGPADASRDATAAACCVLKRCHGTPRGSGASGGACGGAAGGGGNGGNGGDSSITSSSSTSGSSRMLHGTSCGLVASEAHREGACAGTAAGSATTSSYASAVMRGLKHTAAGVGLKRPAAEVRVSGPSC